MAWAPTYVTVDELAAYQRIDDDLDDVQLARAVEAASRAVDDHCNRQFGQVATATTRRYTATWNARRGRWVVAVDDLVDDTGITVQLPAGQVDSYDLEPVNAVADGLAYTRLSIGCDSTYQPTGADDELTVTALWGWPTVPVAVAEAAMLQASRFASRRESPYGVAGSPQLGSEMRLLSRVDPDVGVSLRRYRRRRRVG